MLKCFAWNRIQEWGWSGILPPAGRQNDGGIAWCLLEILFLRSQ